MTETGWTFAILTDGKSQKQLMLQLESIHNLQLEIYEIIIIGGVFIDHPRVRHIEFDESKKNGWVTRKKNILAQEASYENIAFMHDYIGLDRDWAAGFEILGDNWNIALTRVEDLKGRRFYDWAAWDSVEFPTYSPVPYSRKNHTGFQFIPGAYWVAKKDFMLKNPLDEELGWGQSEDIEWSLRVRNQGYVFNPYSKVRHLKKHRGFKLTKSIYDDGFQMFPRPDYLNWEPI